MHESIKTNGMPREVYPESNKSRHGVVGKIASAISHSKEQIELGDYKSALSILDEACENCATKDRIPLEGLRADCYLALKNYSAASQCYERIKSTQPEAPFWVSVGYANVLERNGNHSKSIDQMCLALEQKYSVELAKRAIKLSAFTRNVEAINERIAKLTASQALIDEAEELAVFLITDGNANTGCSIFNELAKSGKHDEVQLVKKMITACLEAGQSDVACKQIDYWIQVKPGDEVIESLYHRCHESRALDTCNGLPCLKVEKGVLLSEFELIVNGNKVRKGLERYAKPLVLDEDGTSAGVISQYVIALPKAYVDSKKDSYVLSVNELSGDKKQYKCSYPLKSLTSSLKEFYQGDFEYLGDNRLHGWYKSALSESSKLALYINGEYLDELTVGGERYDVMEKHGSDYLSTGFDYTWPAAIKVDKLELKDSITGDSVLNTPVFVQRLDEAVSSLETALSNENNIQKSIGGTAKQRIFKELRKMPSTFIEYDTDSKYPDYKREDGVSIIVPIYNGLEDVKRCISSIITSESSGNFEIVCINDESKDVNVKHYLNELEENHSCVTVINSDINRGFVKSVNKGISARLYHDAIILNSDTVVPAGFVNRMKAAHCLDKTFGVITPLSNNATIFSFPITLEDNSFTNIDDLGVVDQVLQENSVDSVFEMPTGHGFCMFVSGEVLESVDGFDDKEWGIGYGEENDFCQKVKMKGWKIGAYFGMYVGHVGSVSFGSEKRDVQVKKNGKRLLELYPEYDQLIQRHIQQEGVSRIERNRLQIILWKKSSPGTEDVLFLSHSLGGGTSEYINRSIAALAQENSRSIILSTEGSDLVLQDVSRSIYCVYRDSEIDSVRDHLVLLGASEVVINSACNFPHELFEKFESVVDRYTVVIHDYSWICPRVNMIDASGSYCGMPSNDVCVKCVNVSGTHPSFRGEWRNVSVSMDLWLTRNKTLLEGASKVIAPSDDAAKRIEAKFTTVSPVVLSHSDYFELEANVVRYTAECIEDQVIGIFGMIGDHKGLELIKKLCWKFSTKHPGIQFVFFGILADYDWMSGYNNVKCAGEYTRSSLPGLVRREKPTAALFLSVCPETYCYAFTDAVENGVFPIAFDLGAFSERIKMHDYGETIPFNTSEESVYQSLVSVMSSDRFSAAEVSNIKSGTSYSGFKENYLSHVLSDEFLKMKAASGNKN